MSLKTYLTEASKATTTAEQAFEIIKKSGASSSDVIWELLKIAACWDTADQMLEDGESIKDIVKNNISLISERAVSTAYSYAKDMVNDAGDLSSTMMNPYIRSMKLK